MPWAIVGSAALSLAGDLFGAHKGASAQAKANKMNLQISREQRAWEQDMANTAVQRRADDLEKAGFNRLLAATGAGASTPSVSTAPMQPTFRPEWTKDAGRGISNALLLKEQLLNMRANTAQQAAQARITNVEAKIREDLAGMETDVRANRFVEQKEWDDLKTKIMRNTHAVSAADRERIEKTTDAVIRLAQDQAREKKLNVDALENVAKAFGLEAGRFMPIIKAVIDIFKD